MDVLKRSEFCGGSKGKLLKDIMVGTIFRGSISDFPPHVWVRTNSEHGRAICIGEEGADRTMRVGYACYDCDTVVGYEVLNATLVIGD